MDDKLTIIHKYLLSQNVENVPQDFAAFSKLMDNDEKSGKVHQYLLSQNIENVDTDFNKFKDYVGLKKKDLSFSDATTQGKEEIPFLGMSGKKPIASSDSSVQTPPLSSADFKPTQLSPKDEVDFQEWTKDAYLRPDYDYRGLFLNERNNETLGKFPKHINDYYKTDPNLHLYSIGEGGRVLKSPEHPTFEKTIEGEKSVGNELYRDKEGILRTKPKTAHTVGEYITSIGGVIYKQALAPTFDMLDKVQTMGGDAINQIIYGKNEANEIKKFREEVGVPLMEDIIQVRPFEAISNAINWYANQYTLPLPKDTKTQRIIGGAIEGGAGVIPLAVAAMYAPEVALSKMYQDMGIKTASKFGEVLAVQGAVNSAKGAEGETPLRQIAAPIIGAIEGYMTGFTFDNMGQLASKIGANVASRVMPKVATTGQAIYKALVETGTTTLSNGVFFGTYGNLEEYLQTGKISAETFATQMGVGIMLGMREPAKLLFTKGLHAFVATPKIVVNRLHRSDFTAEEYAKLSQNKINEIENGTSVNKDVDLAAAKISANMSILKAFTDEVKDSPDKVIESVRESTLDPKMQEVIIDKVNEVTADNDPKIQATTEINQKIAKIDDALKVIGDNKSWDDTRREIESAPLKERKEELKQDAKKVYGIEPKAKTEGAEEKPKAPQTESSKKFLAELDKPIKKEEGQKDAGSEEKKNISVNQEVIPEQKSEGTTVNDVRPVSETGIQTPQEKIIAKEADSAKQTLNDYLNNWGEKTLKTKDVFLKEIKEDYDMVLTKLKNMDLIKTDCL